MSRALAVRPRGPYSLAFSARLASDATRRFRDGVLEAVVLADGAPERVRARQLPDGTLELVAATDAGLERLRFVLGVEDDHSEFLRRFGRDPLLGKAVSRLRGLRPVRVPTVAQALLRALCGQLVDWKTARRLERRVTAATSGTFADGLVIPPTAATLGALPPARLRALGLHARRAATLVRICRSFDVERLRDVPTAAVVARIERERGLGPWSAGVICLEGLGRYEHGLVGDLGLLELCGALLGRRAEAEDTAELLARYEEWAGLASVYLLAAFSRGLVPLPAGIESRHDPLLQRRVA